MIELTIERTVRDGLWVARDGEESVLVRSVPAERVELYQRAARTPLPIPGILYVGPDAAGSQYVVVEKLLGPDASHAQARTWRNLASLEPLFRSDADRALLALGRTAEALAWFHASGFLHGNVTPNTIWLHPRGWVRLAGLDCLQPAPGPAACLAYSSVYACREQIESWITDATDVRLLGLAFARVTGVWFPGSHAAADDGPSTGGYSLSGLLTRMAAKDATSRPSVPDILTTVFGLFSTASL